MLAELEMRAPGETEADIAKRYGISEKTLQRTKARAHADAALAEAVRQKKAEFAQSAQGWRQVRIRFLRKSIAKLGQLVDEATVSQIREVAGAIKIVGELEAVTQALGDEDGEQPSGTRQGSTTKEVEGEAGRDAGRSPSATGGDASVH
jgi:hypothetical protein